MKIYYYCESWVCEGNNNASVKCYVIAAIRGRPERGPIYLFGQGRGDERRKGERDERDWVSLFSGCVRMLVKMRVFPLLKSSVTPCQK